MPRSFTADPELACRASRIRWEKQRAAEIVPKIEELVRKGPPLTAAQYDQIVALCAASAGIPVPASEDERSSGDAA